MLHYINSGYYNQYKSRKIYEKFKFYIILSSVSKNEVEEKMHEHFHFDHTEHIKFDLNQPKLTTLQYDKIVKNRRIELNKIKKDTIPIISYARFIKIDLYNLNTIDPDLLHENSYLFNYRVRSLFKFHILSKPKLLKFSFFKHNIPVKIKEIIILNKINELYIYECIETLKFCKNTVKKFKKIGERKLKTTPILNQLNNTVKELPNYNVPISIINFQYPEHFLIKKSYNIYPINYLEDIVKSQYKFKRRKQQNIHYNFYIDTEFLFPNNNQNICIEPVSSKYEINCPILNISSHMFDKNKIFMKKQSKTQLISSISLKEININEVFPDKKNDIQPDNKVIKAATRIEMKLNQNYKIIIDEINKEINTMIYEEFSEIASKFNNLEDDDNIVKEIIKHGTPKTDNLNQILNLKLLIIYFGFEPIIDLIKRHNEFEIYQDKIYFWIKKCSELKLEHPIINIITEYLDRKLILIVPHEYISTLMTFFSLKFHQIKLSCNFKSFETTQIFIICCNQLETLEHRNIPIIYFWMLYEYDFGPFDEKYEYFYQNNYLDNFYNNSLLSFKKLKIFSLSDEYDNNFTNIFDIVMRNNIETTVINSDPLFIIDERLFIYIIEMDKNPQIIKNNFISVIFSNFIKFEIGLIIIICEKYDNYYFNFLNLWCSLSCIIKTEFSREPNLITISNSNSINHILTHYLNCYTKTLIHWDKTDWQNRDWIIENSSIVYKKRRLSAQLILSLIELKDLIQISSEDIKICYSWIPIQKFQV
ncbi:hypothetical protein HZS_5996 [Henneguya salminicola]|nr:hypothetical protein HZS_5996 [Henneguya salminicola]